MGVVSIDAFLVCLKSSSNFHGENPVAFRLIFVVEIQQYFTSIVSQHTECYPHQTFDMRIQQWGCPIFTAKIWQSFAFGVLWCTNSVSHLCIWHVSTCLYCDEPKPFKASSMLMRVAYTGKPMSLGDMDQNNHITMIVHTIQHEYALTAITLSTYLHYKVKSSHDQRGSLTQPRESIQSAQSSMYKQIQIYIHHAQCYHTKQKSKPDIANIPRV